MWTVSGQVTEFAPDGFVVGAVMPAVLGGAFEGDEVWYRALEANTHVHGVKGFLKVARTSRGGGSGSSGSGGAVFVLVGVRSQPEEDRRSSGGAWGCASLGWCFGPVPMAGERFEGVAVYFGSGVGRFGAGNG